MSGPTDNIERGAGQAEPAGKQEFASDANAENQPYISIEIDHAKTGNTSIQADQCEAGQSHKIHQSTVLTPGDAGDASNVKRLAKAPLGINKIVTTALWTKFSSWLLSPGFQSSVQVTTGELCLATNFNSLTAPVHLIAGLLHAHMSKRRCVYMHICV